MKFRRQKVVHGYIADFYCAEHALILEIDGPVHALEENVLSAAERDRALDRFGISVVRVGNHQVDREFLTRRLRDFLEGTSAADSSPHGLR